MWPVSQDLPWGVRFLRFLRVPSPFSRLTTYRIAIVFLTYLFYVNYHIARKPLSVVKNVLHQNCSSLPPPASLTELELRNGTWCQWAPFDKNSTNLFLTLDFLYRFIFVGGMIGSGFIAERVNLRLFLTFGMVSTGFFLIFNGMAYFWNVHSFSYFVVAQVFSGLLQATGFPCVLTLMGNWFGKKRRGLVFGIWNSHTNVGNILGAVIAGVWVSSQWGYSFIVPGLMIIVCGIIAYLFVVVHPNCIALPTVHNLDDKAADSLESSDIMICENGAGGEAPVADPLREIEQKPVSLWGALLIPGVIEYSLSLFFCKLVYYSFFNWLPVYIKATSHVENKEAADISAVFDAGGVIGGILAGGLSDATGGSATVCGFFFILAIPSIYCMVLYVQRGVSVLIALLVITGFFVNGPYTLIVTAVASDLGTRPDLTKNKKSLSTVIGIIDGMGSLGSAIGPVGAAQLSKYGWHIVFYYLIVAQIVSLLCLTRLIYREILNWKQLWSEKRRNKMPSSDTTLNLTRMASNAELESPMTEDFRDTAAYTDKRK